MSTLRRSTRTSRVIDGSRRVRERLGCVFPARWDGFELAVRAVLGQQVSVTGARTLAGTPRRGARRVARTGRGGRRRPTGPPVPRAGGRRGRRSHRRRSHALARGGAAGSRCGDGFRSGPLATLRDARRDAREAAALPGVGPWTAQYIAMQARCASRTRSPRPISGCFAPWPRPPVGRPPRRSSREPRHGVRGARMRQCASGSRDEGDVVVNRLRSRLSAWPAAPPLLPAALRRTRARARAPPSGRRSSGRSRADGGHSGLAPRHSDDRPTGDSRRSRGSRGRATRGRPPAAAAAVAAGRTRRRPPPAAGAAAAAQACVPAST